MTNRTVWAAKMSSASRQALRPARSLLAPLLFTPRLTPRHYMGTGFRCTGGANSIRPPDAVRLLPCPESGELPPGDDVHDADRVVVGVGQEGAAAVGRKRQHLRARAEFRL